MGCWVCIGVMGPSSCPIHGKIRDVSYCHWVGDFLDVASRQPGYRGDVRALDSKDLLPLSPSLDFVVMAKSVFWGGKLVKRALRDLEVAQVLDWRKELGHHIHGVRGIYQCAGLTPLPVCIPVAILVGFLPWIEEELGFFVPAGSHDEEPPPRDSDGPMVDTPTGLRGTGFYGHYTDPGDALDVTVATHSMMPKSMFHTGLMAAMDLVWRRLRSEFDIPA